MVRSMTLSHAVPHFHYSDEVRLGALMALRSRLKADAALHGVKLTYLPFIIKAISVALREYPIINSSISEDGSTVWPCSPSKKGGGQPVFGVFLWMAAQMLPTRGTAQHHCRPRIHCWAP
jgi:2-oxoacid dehydrogenases acyltransferase (catalytic domain)